ncbi:BRD4-interacting chromatin-remodeling complex-associated protein [Salarias fasciatus]|uniref:BRD4-interacting chromatin-remodeling complex-associated protein n=1 Tax=Salarias fasciatus TaxID=181472 RepID=UPI001176B04A|nr:BRD4-interacting chromatin-remodeling complex-associated protein-like [Salarias fasciatus]
MDMEDEDGTCLLDVLCDPQALNDFLHGTNELQTEDLLISASSGEPSLFTEAPSPVSLLGDGGDSPDTPPPGCVDLSFLEEALLSSPEGGADLLLEAKKGVEEVEVEVACDILQQSLQEAEITEQTMALEADLAQTGDGLSLYSPAPLLPFIPKAVTLPVASALPRDTQAAVEPPQPSLLAVGPGCPSLKPAAPPPLMGLLPGNVFPAPPPETSFSLSPAQGSSMIIHKAVAGAASRPLVTPALRATTTAAAPGAVPQRAPLPIQPKLPVSIQPRLVQISPKPSGQKPAPGITFVPGTAPSNILLSQSASRKSAIPPAQNAQQLPKPLSLQLVNQGASFLLQPQGLFQAQNQLLVPGQSPVTISQAAGAARPLLTPGLPGPSVHGVTPSAGQLVDGSQILTVPQRQLNFGPVFATPTGQLALRQATVLSGPLQLQSAPAAVFQMPAQLAGAYTPGGPGQRATLVHSPALGNHITLINSSGVLPSDLTSISIVNGPPVVQGLPFAAQTAASQPDRQPSLQQASVVLLPDRSVQEESRSGPTFHQLQQSYGHVVQQVALQPTSSPSAAPVLQSPPEPTPAPSPAVKTPPGDVSPAVEEETDSVSPNQASMQRLQQEALDPPVSPELVGALPAVPVGLLGSPAAADAETRPASDAVCSQDTRPTVLDQCVEVSPLRSDPEDTASTCSPDRTPDPGRLAGPPSTLPFSDSSVSQTTTPQVCVEPPVRYPGPHQLRVSQALCTQPPVQVQTSVSQPQVTSSMSQPRSGGRPSASPPQRQSAAPPGEDQPGVPLHTHNKPAAASVVGSESFPLDVHPPSPAAPGAPGQRPLAPMEGPPLQPGQQSNEPAGPPEQRTDETPAPAGRRHRFQQQLCSDRAAAHSPPVGPAFSTLKDAVRRLLPYHACAGRLPTKEDFGLVDQEFDTVSGFLLKRTKDMINKYRQLLVREAQQDSPSAEMVMLERLFLQAERHALVEDRRRARRDPETFLTALAPPPHAAQSSCSPASPPAWTRLSDRPPGLKTYRSSSRGALRLTIKQESGSRKVVHNSAWDPGLKRDHTGQLANGGGAAMEHGPEPPGGSPRQPRQRQMSNGHSCEDAPQEAPVSRSNTPGPPSAPEPDLQPPPRDVSAPKLRCCRLDASPGPPPVPEDHVLSEHLQSAIDSILELQRLQGPSAAPGRAPSRAPAGPPPDQPLTSILEGHL